MASYPSLGPFLAKFWLHWLFFTPCSPQTFMGLTVSVCTVHITWNPSPPSCSFFAAPIQPLSSGTGVGRSLPSVEDEVLFFGSIPSVTCLYDSFILWDPHLSNLCPVCWSTRPLKAGSIPDSTSYCIPTPCSVLAHSMSSAEIWWMQRSINGAVIRPPAHCLHKAIHEQTPFLQWVTCSLFCFIPAKEKRRGWDWLYCGSLDMTLFSWHQGFA